MMNLDKAFATFPQIETERLTLRRMTRRDASDHFAVFRQPQVAAAHGMPPYEKLAESKKLIDWYDEAFSEKRAIRWAITLRDDGRLLGTCGFHTIHHKHAFGEIGYELHPNYWRQGIGSEAVRAIVGFGFLQMGFHRIEAIVDPDNAASANLLRRVGFTEEGFLRERFYDNGRFVDDWFFSILAHEYHD